VGNVKQVVRTALKRLGVDVRRIGGHDWTDIGSFIPFEPTLKAADAAGLSVGDYIDQVMNGIPGATQNTIDQMRSLGVFSGKLATVLEIGPGSGRYLEKTLRECSPERYEIYETAEPWAAYVVKKYGVVRQPTDGASLAATPASSVDLVQAHKVFSGVELMITLQYWREMVRVTRAEGYVAFDIVTEGCLMPETVARWVDSGMKTGAYPSAVPRQVAVRYFEENGFACVGSFLVPMGPGLTETIVFRKRAPPG
jgi:hypothetical protein